jgi:hypothetical protein
MKRDLKDWCISKELALDRRECKLAIHVPESIFDSFFFIVFCRSFFSCPFSLFLA